MKKIIYSIFACCAFIGTLNAQVTTEERIEFELKEGYAGFELNQFRDQGVLVHYHDEKAKGGVMKWKIDHYSTNLKLEDSEEFSISDNYYLKEAKEVGSSLYMFFTTRKGEYQLTIVDVETLKTKDIKGVLPKKSFAGGLHVVDNTAFMYCSSKSAKILKKIDLESGKDQDIALNITGYKPSAISVENVQIDEDSRELYLFLNARIKKDFDVYVQRYNNEGVLQETFNLSENSPKKLTSVSGSYLSDGEYIFTGTYSSKSAATSEGIYICKTTKGKKDFLNFYNFTEFEEFLSYLPQKKQDKIEKKKSKTEAKGKEFSLSYLMASHNVRFMDGKFIYIGEAFYPTYRTETRTTYVNGKATTTTVQVFDGYQYTHATIAAFDLDGTKLWDKTFEMFPWYKPYYVKRFIEVTETSTEQLGLMFSSGSTIKSMAVSTEGDVLEDRSIDMIETGDEEDKVKSTFSNLTFWYDNFFLAHGTQTIKNTEDKEEKGKNKRRVYFINKISYQL